MGFQGTRAEIFEQLRADLDGGWKDPVEVQRSLDFISGVLTNYSAALGLEEDAILQALEARRGYWSKNYYQEANFPRLEGVLILENKADFKMRFPSGKYCCPRCHGISTDPNVCNSGLEMDKGKRGKKGPICDWKSYGLFRTLSGGLRFACKEGFLEHPVVYDIFLPLEMEGVDPEKTRTSEGEK